jgi:hypothetical protein
MRVAEYAVCDACMHVLYMPWLPFFHDVYAFTLGWAHACFFMYIHTPAMLVKIESLDMYSCMSDMNAFASIHAYFLMNIHIPAMLSVSCSPGNNQAFMMHACMLGYVSMLRVCFACSCFGSCMHLGSWFENIATFMLLFAALRVGRIYVEINACMDAMICWLRIFNACPGAACCLNMHANASPLFQGENNVRGKSSRPGQDLPVQTTCDSPT